MSVLDLDWSRDYRDGHIPAYDFGAMSEPLHPVQIEGFKRMTPAQKLDMVCDLYEAGIQLRIAGLKAEHPGWPRERLDREARLSLLHAGT